MKRIHFFLSLFLPLTVQANSIDADQAFELARKHLSRPVRADAVQVLGSRAYSGNGGTKAALHLFNNADGEGFAIVSSDDRVGTVLGYSHTGSLNDTDMPQGLRNLLADYVRAVETVQVDSVSIVPYYTSFPKAYVKPIVKAKWSQEYPYNYYTPYSNGKRTFTGCVITAAAQVMSAHRWPKNRPSGGIRGEGAQAYDYYDWDNMLSTYTNGYTDEQAQAVGVLMRDIGYLSHANYGNTDTKGTECDEGKVWMSIHNYYDYTSRFIEKDILPGGEFLQTVYNELSMGCPVLMFGGDHSFLYDGYDENGLVHVNWGWAGLYNGYYDINTAAVTGSASTDGQYYEKQVAILMHPNNGLIEPLEEQPVMLSVNNNEGLQFTVTQGTIRSHFPARLKGVGARNLVQGEDGTYTGRIGIGLFTADSECLHVFEAPFATETWSSFYNTKNYEPEYWTLNLDEMDDISDGTYWLRPLGHRLLSSDPEVWENWREMVNANSVPMVVSDGNVTLLPTATVPELKLVGEPEILAPAYEGGSLLAGISLNIANTTRCQARGSITLTLHGTGALEGETYNVPSAYLSHFVAQRMDTTQWILKFVTSYTGTYGTQALKAGKYTLEVQFNHNREVTTDNTYPVAMPSDFTLTVLPSSYEGRVTITSAKILTNGNDSETTFFCAEDTPSITLGTSGYAAYLTSNSLSTQLRYRLVNTATKATAYTSSAYSVIIPRNSDSNLSDQTRCTVDLTALPLGEYEIHVDVLHNGEWEDHWNANSARRRFTVLSEDEITGTDTIQSVPTGNPVPVIYDLNGRRVHKADIRGIYIENGHKVLK